MKHSTALLKCLALTLLLVTACAEDEKESKNYKVIIPAEFEGGEVVAFITDKSGKLLDLKKGFPSSVIELDGGTADEVTLHNLIRLEVSPGTYRYKLDSYTNVPNRWTLNVLAIVTPPAPGEAHHLAVTGVPSEFTTASLFGPNVHQLSQLITGPDLNLQALLNQDNSQVAYLLIPPNNTPPRYASFPNAHAGDHEALTFSEMEEAETVTIDFGKSAEQISLIQEVMYEKTKFPIAQYLLDEADHVNVYTYPNDVVTFSKTTISFYANDAYYSYYRYGQPVDEFYYIDADVTGLTMAGNKLTVSTTGSYDYVTLRSQEDWSSELAAYTLQWNINIRAKDKKTVIVPDIPQAIKDEWPKLNNAQIAFDYAEAVEHVSYDDYLRATSARIKTSLPPQDTKIIGRGFGSPVNPGRAFQDE